MDDPQEEAKVEIYSSESESSSESSIGELDYAIEQREEEERKLEETLLNASENDNEGIQRAFDLKKNLDNIDCSRFYEPLIQEGFIDEVRCFFTEWLYFVINYMNFICLNVGVIRESDR